ncbi:MAG TPA: hypothetical protein VGP25_04245 [Gemmatimonadaceae bacterium]|nr:hypothetical protein [Gemmatimonadaceae bacterium]
MLRDMFSAIPQVERPEPRWPAILASFSAVALHFVLPAPLRVGPPWVLAILVVSLALAAHVFRSRGWHRQNSWMGYAVLSVLAFGLLYGVGALVAGLVHHAADAIAVLRSAAILWTINVIVFAGWYWRLDAGGPNERERRRAHTSGAFLFPQMTYSVPGESDRTIAEHTAWRPSFVDYLFLSFNTSTAFSPTDVPVLSSKAKLAMMLQSLISLTTIVLLAGRAVNIL